MNSRGRFDLVHRLPAATRRAPVAGRGGLGASGDGHLTAAVGVRAAVELSFVKHHDVSFPLVSFHLEPGPKVQVNT